MEILLDIWREVAQHADAGDVLQGIAARVAPLLPFDLIAIRRLQLDRLTLETVAAAATRVEVAIPRQTRTKLEPRQYTQVLSWARTGGTRTGQLGAGEPLLSALAPPGTGGALLAGPLTRDGELAGVAVLLRGDGLWDASAQASFARLLDPLSTALANHHRLHELTQSREALEADKRALLSRLERHDLSDVVVGADAGLRHVMKRIEQVASTDVPVLVLGETGTGKEVVARALHARSKRATAPIVRVNCGAIPAGLVDSELFGHEKGSFTGAVNTRHGWFERADGGTLFLDEVGELPLEAQVRLLRIVQDGTFERVGAQRSLTVDVRIVAATNRDLEEMVAKGGFREDLWYRLSVFPIRLPPLRERPEDIPLLASHFAWRAGMRLGGAPLSLSQEDTALLVSYTWPGNVRELAAVIERAAILGSGHELHVGAALGWHPGTPAGSSAAPAAPTEVAPLMTLDAHVRQHIELALRHRGGRVEGADGVAVLLGINPHTLRSRMRKLGVDWSQYRLRALEGDRPPRGARPPIATLAAAAREHITRTLEATGGRIEGRGGAAAMLGINPHTLRARMRKLGVDWSRYRADRRK